MNWKNLSIIIGIYLLIFGFIFYLLLPTETDETVDDVSAGEALSNFFSNFRSSFSNSISNIGNSFSFISEIRLTKYLMPSSCNFRRDIECMYFDYNKEDKEIIFQFKNLMNNWINVMEVEVKGDINCFAESEASLNRNDFFFVKLEDCEIDGIESDIRLKYHEGNPMFYRYVEGRLIAR